MPSKDPGVRLRHIVENADRISEYTAEMEMADFLRDQITIDAVERCMQRITEAARILGDQFDLDYPDLNLPELRKFGSVLGMAMKVLYQR